MGMNIESTKCKLFPGSIDTMSSAPRPKDKEELIELSPEEEAALEAGILSEKTDRIYTVEESFELARKLHKEWVKAPTTRAA